MLSLLGRSEAEQSLFHSGKVCTMNNIDRNECSGMRNAPRREEVTQPFSSGVFKARKKQSGKSLL
jgi:hypothetical protein